MTGFGEIPENETTLSISRSSIPPTITITSSHGGKVTIPVNINGNGNPDSPIVADAGPNQSVTIGEQAQITLDGSQSIGAIDTYLWEPLPGNPITLSGANTPTATFDTPTTPGVYQFQLTVTGESVTAISTVTVTVLSSEPNPDPDPTPTPDTLTVSEAKYLQDNGRWTINGTAGPGVTVTIKVVSSGYPNGLELGTATVDAAGDWRLRSTWNRNTRSRAGSIENLLIESSSGRTLTATPDIRK